eukprot:TRINITY_DN113127_c0_g1_i1.p1 TRINITY_DN113127_c0_g1~~TRINITY_DN113127_c0_g1_i1.p1  ORF type:complete len:402 (-),score=126.80 TRINITY_DN113127_c0_g1_i1:101-1243(-)
MAFKRLRPTLLRQNGSTRYSRCLLKSGVLTALLGLVVVVVGKVQSAFAGVTRSSSALGCRQAHQRVLLDATRDTATATPSLEDVAHVLGVQGDGAALAKAVADLKRQLAESESELDKASSFAKKADALSEELKAVKASSDSAAKRLADAQAAQSELQQKADSSAEEAATTRREIEQSSSRAQGLNRTLQSSQVATQNEAAANAEKLASSAREKEEAIAALTRLQKEGEDADTRSKTLLSSVTGLRKAVTDVLVEAGALRNPATDAGKVEKQAEEREQKAEAAEQERDAVAAELKRLQTGRMEVQLTSKDVLESFKAQEDELKTVQATISEWERRVKRVADAAGVGGGGGLLSMFEKQKTTEELIVAAKQKISEMAAGGRA